MNVNIYKPIKSFIISIIVFAAIWKHIILYFILCLELYKLNSFVTSVWVSIFLKGQPLRDVDRGTLDLQPITGIICVPWNTSWFWKAGTCSVFPPTLFRHKCCCPITLSHRARVLSFNPVSLRTWLLVTRPPFLRTRILVSTHVVVPPSLNTRMLVRESSPVSSEGLTEGGGQFSGNSGWWLSKQISPSSG